MIKKLLKEVVLSGLLYAIAPAPGGGFHLFGASPDRLAVGDEVAFFDSSEGKTIMRTKVASLNKGIATFDPPVDPASLDLIGDPFDAPGTGREHENLLIANNTFANWYREPGLGIHGVKGLRFTGNRFIKDPKHPYFQGTPDTVIHIENSEDITLTGNQNDTPAKEFVHVDPYSDRISVGE